MKKLYLLSAFLIFACSTDSEGNPCVYEPTLTTQAATDITETSATLNGVISIVSDNCEVPNNTEQGFVYSAEIQPTLEDIQVNVNGTNILTTIEGLTPNTTYYVRAFLTNNFGDFYGDEVEFTTNEGGSCDGVPYDSIVYGTQEWTVENACPITYRDGTPIPEVTDNTEWENLTSGAWAYYNNDPTKPRFYNWYAVMGIHDTNPNTPNKEFAPAGWHVPSDAEWTTLGDHLIANGYNYNPSSTFNGIGKAMASTTGWDSWTQIGTIGDDQSLNNSSGFNAFPEGFRNPDGSFEGEGSSATFWSSSEYNILTYRAVYHCLFHTNNSLGSNNSFKSVGFSVRLVRD